MVESDTWRTPDQGFTAGSQSNKTQYAAKGGLRQAAAEARLALLGMASARLGAPIASLTVKDGVVRGGSGKVSYAELIGNRRFDLKITGKADAEALPGLQARRHQRPARRRPGQGDRRVRVTRRTSASTGWSTRASSARRRSTPSS